MRALSIWQPWASAVALGAKQIETRSFATEYRGPIAIHASKRCVKKELTYLGNCWSWCTALQPIGKEMGDGKNLWDLLPFGAVIAIADLVDCQPAGDIKLQLISIPRSRGHTGTYADTLQQWTEQELGDFSLGRFGWVLANVRPLKTPLPFKGAQGFFHVPDRLIEAAL